MLISIDHGNKQVKTIHCAPIVAGLERSTTKPFGADVLTYEDAYYTLSARRIPYQKDKTKDERYFILSLFAIANELETTGNYTDDLQLLDLAIGLPPAHYGAQHLAFEHYFQNRDITSFTYHNKVYNICFGKVACFPQAYAAAVTMMPVLVNSPKVLILDIGGFTADYLLMKSGRADLSNCDSLENGVILLYNKIRSKANAELDLLLEESDIDAILQGNSTGYSFQVIQIVEDLAKEFVGDLFGTLRERMLDPRTGKAVFVGGGALLLRRFIEASGRVGEPIFVTDINANARGFELLYQTMMESR